MSDLNAVLFVCHLNSIRSPIAEGLMKSKCGDNVYVQSCGLEAGPLDEFMVTIMKEKGIDMSGHCGKTLDDIADTSFDVVIAFTQGAYDAAQTAFKGSDAEIELWPTPDPTEGMINVRAIMDNYRAVRDHLDGRLDRRFKLKQ